MTKYRMTNLPYEKYRMTNYHMTKYRMTNFCIEQGSFRDRQFTNIKIMPTYEQ